MVTKTNFGMVHTIELDDLEFFRLVEDKNNKTFHVVLFDLKNDMIYSQEIYFDQGTLIGEHNKYVEDFKQMKIGYIRNKTIDDVIKKNDVEER